MHHTSLEFSNCNKDQAFEIDLDVGKPENLDKEVPIGIESENKENSENEEGQVFDDFSLGDKVGFLTSIATLPDGVLTEAQNELTCESSVLAEIGLFELGGIFRSVINQAMQKELNETEGPDVITRMSLKNNVPSWFMTNKLVFDKLVCDSVASGKEAVAKGLGLREIFEATSGVVRYIWVFQHDFGMYKGNFLVDRALLWVNMDSNLLDTGQVTEVTLLLVNDYCKDCVVEDFITDVVRFLIHNPNLRELFEEMKKQSIMNDVNRVVWLESYFSLRVCDLFATGQRIKASGLSRDVLICNVVIGKCSKSGKVGDVQFVLKEVLEKITVRWSVIVGYAFYACSSSDILKIVSSIENVRKKGMMYLVDLAAFLELLRGLKANNYRCKVVLAWLDSLNGLKLILFQCYFVFEPGGGIFTWSKNEAAMKASPDLVERIEETALAFDIGGNTFAGMEHEQLVASSLLEFIIAKEMALGVASTFDVLTWLLQMTFSEVILLQNDVKKWGMRPYWSSPLPYGALGGISHIVATTRSQGLFWGAHRYFFNDAYWWKRVILFDLTLKLNFMTMTGVLKPTILILGRLLFGCKIDITSLAIIAIFLTTSFTVALKWTLVDSVWYARELATQVQWLHRSAAMPLEDQEFV